MKRFLCALVSVVGLVAAGVGHAAVEADPNKTYLVTPEAGPWMILAANYSGADAAQLARDLALEIRQHHHLPAFVYSRSDEERRKLQQERERLQQILPEGDRALHKTVRIEDHWVVLVGGYKDMEAARKALDDIKKLKPSSHRFMPFLFSGTPQLPDKSKKDDKGGVYINPFSDGFVVRNPTVKMERQEDPRERQFLKDLNSGESYSLLKCRKPWTLIVAAFQGATVIQSQSAGSTIVDKMAGRGSGDRLAASAMNAHNLADVLRKLNYEVYVLHTRQGSVVTVGGFDSEADPRMKQVQQAVYGNLQVSQGVQLLPEPMPLQVPRL